MMVILFISESTSRGQAVLSLQRSDVSSILLYSSLTCICLFNISCYAFRVYLQHHRLQNVDLMSRSALITHCFVPTEAPILLFSHNRSASFTVSNSPFNIIEQQANWSAQFWKWIINNVWGWCNWDRLQCFWNLIIRRNQQTILTNPTQVLKIWYFQCCSNLHY